MEVKKMLDYSIVFTALDEFKSDENNKELFSIINQSQIIKEQQDIINCFREDESYFDSIGYTKA